MSSDGSDDLARTATAHDSQPASSPNIHNAQAIGRYRLERELGAGGMGVVYVAFDPDLERRVALKVLRGATGEDAAKRLQREARAMARLNHPNVVTVHEVGSAAGRDYVAMELIDGQSLADWLRADRRDPHAIVDAFLDAGRGLAAAHAAGIVHRDFKPHNVLRSRTGRIAVTDFGLAREAQDPLAVTQPVAAAADNTPTSLSGITMTGSVLGTPAYMAPEQWAGAELTPATDQFGFCVAMWEALTGERPYRGPTLDDLRAQVAAGPQALDASKIPRKLRPILRRGLDPDRAKRWANMDALLQAIARADRRSWMALAAVGAGLVAAGVLVLVLRGHAATGCTPPLLDPDTVWSDGTAAAIRAAGQGPSVKPLAADAQRWRDTRATVCKLDPARRAPALSCLDGVLARFDAVARAAVMPEAKPIDAGSALIDPAMCAATSVPRIVASTSPLFQETIATTLRENARPNAADQAVIASLVQRASADPCAEALVQVFAADNALTSPEREHAADLAEQAVDRCGDDRIRAEAAMSALDRTLKREIGTPAVAAKLARAEVAVQRVPQADLNAALAEAQMRIDARADLFDKAIDDGQRAVSGYASRGRIAAQIVAGLETVQVRQHRATPDDLAAIASSLAGWRTLAIAELGADHWAVWRLDLTDAGWAWMNGDVAGAHRRLDELRRTSPITNARAQNGVVVDTAGHGVPGATVVAGSDFGADSIAVALPFARDVEHMRWTTTGPDGTFHFADVVPEGFVVAQLGDQRSLPAPIGGDAKLVLEPTSRLTGTVALGGRAALGVVVAASHPNLPFGISYAIQTPVRRDGTFVLDGVPRGDLDVAVVIEGITSSNERLERLHVTAPVVSDLALEVPVSKRTLTVLVRSTVGTPPGNAVVVVMPVAMPESLPAADLEKRFGDLGGLNQALAHPFDPSAGHDAGLGKPGDLVVGGIAAPDTGGSACAIGLPTDLADPVVQKSLVDHAAKIEMRCVPIPSDAKAVVVQVPPWPRFD